MLQAQLEAPKFTTPKILAFSAIVDLIQDTLSSEVLVSTDLLPPKREGMVRAFEACINDFVHLSSSAEKIIWHYR